jgi:hypothetical protein
MDMDLWMVTAREEIRDLVARYNANGDTGRFAQVLELFAPDAVIEAVGQTFTGPAEIATLFGDVRQRTSTQDRSFYLRHMTATHQIDLIDESSAHGRCYYQVLTAIGLDHWGRYIDRYCVIDGRWRFASRRVTLDGHHPDTLMGISDVGGAP